LPKGARATHAASVIGTNIALAALIGLLCWLVGWEDFLLVQARR